MKHYKGILSYERTKRADKLIFFCKKWGYDYIFDRNIISAAYLKDKDIWHLLDDSGVIAGYILSWEDLDGIYHCGIAVSPFYRGVASYEVSKKWLQALILCYTRIEASCYKFNRLSYVFGLRLGFVKFKEDAGQHYLVYKGN